jgi:dihydrodipicolinate synthase/N-acetylneuraminate lyase
MDANLSSMIHPDSAPGALPAMATPLEDDGYTINFDVLSDLVEFLIAAGVHGLFVGGTTGEGILLGEEQRVELHERAVEATAGRVAVIVHVGANTTAASVALAEHAESIGADAIAAVTPYYYQIHNNALLEYYRAVSAAAPSTPLLAYDIPHLAVNSVGPELLRDLAREIPTYAGIKSSQADAQKVRQLIDASRLSGIVLTGNERVALGALALGADGLISGLATAVPEPFVALTAAFGQGDMTEAQRQQGIINRILDLFPNGARIGAIKHILTQRGVAVGPPVPPRPLPPADWNAWPEIQSMLEGVDHELPAARKQDAPDPVRH